MFISQHFLPRHGAFSAPICPLLPIGLRGLGPVVLSSVRTRYKSILYYTEAYIMKVIDGNGMSWGKGMSLSYVKLPYVWVAPSARHLGDVGQEPGLTYHINSW